MSDDSKTFGELLAPAAERDGYKFEWYAGKIVMQASASAFHNLIVSEPDVNRYTRENVSSFGKPFTLPEPLLLTIDTDGYPAAF